jgi:hypothetical protein
MEMQGVLGSHELDGGTCIPRFAPRLASKGGHPLVPSVEAICMAIRRNRPPSVELYPKAICRLIWNGGD